MITSKIRMCQVSGGVGEWGCGFILFTTHACHFSQPSSCPPSSSLSLPPLSPSPLLSLFLPSPPPLLRQLSQLTCGVIVPFLAIAFTSRSPSRTFPSHPPTPPQMSAAMFFGYFYRTAISLFLSCWVLRIFKQKSPKVCWGQGVRRVRVRVF